MGDNYTNSANPDLSPLLSMNYDPKRKSDFMSLTIPEALEMYTEGCEFCESIISEARKKGLSRVIMDNDSFHLVKIGSE